MFRFSKSSLSSLLFVTFFKVSALCHFHFVFYSVVLAKYVEDYTYWNSSLRIFLQSPSTLSLSRSDTHFAVQHWNTLCPWQQKCIHLVITIWLCGPRLRHVVLLRRLWPRGAVHTYALDCSVNSTQEPSTGLWIMWGGQRSVQWVGQDERNLGGSYRCALLIILRTSVSFCGYLICSCLIWRRIVHVVF